MWDIMKKLFSIAKDMFDTECRLQFMIKTLGKDKGATILLENALTSLRSAQHDIDRAIQDVRNANRETDVE